MGKDAAHKDWLEREMQRRQSMTDLRSTLGGRLPRSYRAWHAHVGFDAASFEARLGKFRKQMRAQVEATQRSALVFGQYVAKQQEVRLLVSERARVLKHIEWRTGYAHDHHDGACR